MTRTAASFAALSTLLFACAAPVESEGSSGEAIISPAPLPGPVRPPLPKPPIGPHIPPCHGTTCDGDNAGYVPPGSTDSTCVMTDAIAPAATLDYQKEYCLWLTCGVGVGGDDTSPSYMSTRCNGGTHEEIVEIVDLPPTGTNGCLTAGVYAGSSSATGFVPGGSNYRVHAIVWAHAPEGWYTLADRTTPGATSTSQYDVDLADVFRQGFAGYDRVRVSMSAWSWDANGVVTWEPVGFGLDDPRYVSH